MNGYATGSGAPKGRAEGVRSPPRAPSSQERGDALLMRWRLERAAGVPAAERLAEREAG